MQIQAINNINFGQIYLVKGNYTNKQKNVINQIKKELRKPSEEFGKLSAEDHYKFKNNVDFVMEDSPKHFDSIHLSGRNNVKQVGARVNDTFTCADSFTIGIYDEKHPFKTDDIKYGIEEARKKDSQRLLTLGAAVVAMAVYIMGIALAARHDAINKKLQESTKPLIENVDSVATKAKAALTDTTKVLKSIK